MRLSKQIFCKSSGKISSKICWVRHFDVIQHSTSTKFDFLSSESASDWLTRKVLLATSYTASNPILTFYAPPLIVSSPASQPFDFCNSILVANPGTTTAFCRSFSRCSLWPKILTLRVCVPVTESNNLWGKVKFPVPPNMLLHMGNICWNRELGKCYKLCRY